MKKKQDYIVEEKGNKLLVEADIKELSDNLVTRLIEIRKKMGVTQQAIADMTGMKAPNVTRIESRKYTPTINVLVRYADALGKEIHFEICDKQEKQTPEQPEEEQNRD